VTDESVIHANEKKIKSTNKNDLIIKNSLNIKELFLNKSNSNVKKESDIKIYSKYIKNIVKYDPDDITPLTSLKTFGPYLKKVLKSMKKNFKKRFKKNLLPKYKYGKYSGKGRRNYMKKKIKTKRRTVSKRKIRDYKYNNTVTVYIKSSQNNTFLTSIKRRFLFTKNNIIKFINTYKLKFGIISINKRRSKLFLLKIYKKLIIKITKQFNVTHWASAGTAGFSKTKRGLPYAAQAAGTSLALKLKKKFKFLKGIYVKIKGKGKGRYNALKGLRIGLGRQIPILKISNATALPHNGCKLKKKRRV
jgi:small subunit ribosomal protein S11